MKRHTNWAAQIDEHVIDLEIQTEQLRGQQKFGNYNSAHEMYAVIQEEVEEFWNSVKANDPDPRELLQICATARRALMELCEQGRAERLKEKGK